MVRLNPVKAVFIDMHKKCDCIFWINFLSLLKSNIGVKK